MTISVPEVPDLTAAFEIETKVSLVDHEGLGVIVSEFTSVQQAAFFSGLAEGFSQFDAGKQLLFIAGELKASPVVARGVANLLRDFVAFLDEVTA